MARRLLAHISIQVHDACMPRRDLLDIRDAIGGDVNLDALQARESMKRLSAGERVEHLAGLLLDLDLVTTSEEDL